MKLIFGHSSTLMIITITITITIIIILIIMIIIIVILMMMMMMMIIVAAAVSESEVNERGSSLIKRRTHFSSKRKGLWSKAQGTVVMREWRN